MTVSPLWETDVAREDGVKPSGLPSANRPLTHGGPGGRAAACASPIGGLMEEDLAKQILSGFADMRLASRDQVGWCKAQRFRAYSPVRA